MADHYHIYRGQDGVFDYVNAVAAMALDDAQVVIAAQTLPAGTVWHYVRRLVKDCCGKESADSPVCIVRIDEDGQIRGEAPNAPVNLVAQVRAGGVIRLRWRYVPDGQETPAAGFVIYVYNEDVPLAAMNWYRKPLLGGWFNPANEQHSWPLSGGWFGPFGHRYDWEIPAGIVASGIVAGGEFFWDSPALVHGRTYRFVVRAYSEAGELSANTTPIAATADAVGPAAAAAPLVEWSED
jgi:hypothetical protein